MHGMQVYTATDKFQMMLVNLFQRINADCPTLPTYSVFCNKEKFFVQCCSFLSGLLCFYLAVRRI